jgi:hypothetical protein
VNKSTFISAENIPVIFEGLSFNLMTMRVILPDGTPLRKEQFKVLYGGYTYALDFSNEHTTRDAWRAFTNNMAFRPPFVKPR